MIEHYLRLRGRKLRAWGRRLLVVKQAEEILEAARHEQTAS